MLQENHVPFEVAPYDVTCNSLGEGWGPAAPAEASALEADLQAPSTSLVPATVTNVMRQLVRAQSTVAEDDEIRSDLRELRRGGEKVATPGQVGNVTPASSALWFEGAWRVHALLDVLRQYFLKAPLASAARPPPRLPQLIAPAPFSHAATQWAEVLRTQTLQITGQGGSHIAELGGFFFPGQVRRLLELLRVVLPSSSCSLSADPRHSTGLNAFTLLGLRRVEVVECEQILGADGAIWKWEFKLGT